MQVRIENETGSGNLLTVLINSPVIVLIEIRFNNSMIILHDIFAYYKVIKILSSKSSKIKFIII